MDDSIFVYRKKYDFVVLDLNSATQEAEGLLKSGYIHVATLKASTWLQNFLCSSDNERSDYISEFYR